MYTKRKVAALTLVWIVLTLAMLGVLYAYNNTQRNIAPFSEFQTMEAMQRDYKACKENAQEEFDCIMTPTLVSKQFIIENNK
jgi:hypothetical protein